MSRLSLLIIVAAISTAVIASEPVGVAELSALQIVEKNVAARGGLEAWRKSRPWSGSGTSSARAQVLPACLCA